MVLWIRLFVWYPVEVWQSGKPFCIYSVAHWGAALLWYLNISIRCSNTLLGKSCISTVSRPIVNSTGWARHLWTSPETSRHLQWSRRWAVGCGLNLRLAQLCSTILRKPGPSLIQVRRACKNVWSGKTGERRWPGGGRYGYGRFWWWNIIKRHPNLILRPHGPSKQVGDDVSKCVGCVFCIEIACGNGRNHCIIDKNQMFQIFALSFELFCQAFGEKRGFERCTPNEHLTIMFHLQWLNCVVVASPLSVAWLRPSSVERFVCSYMLWRTAVEHREW